MERAIALVRTVLPTPGTSSISTWPRQITAIRLKATGSAFPTMTRSTFATTFCTAVARSCTDCIFLLSSEVVLRHRSMHLELVINYTSVYLMLSQDTRCLDQICKFVDTMVSQYNMCRLYIRDLMGFCYACIKCYCCLLKSS